MGRRAKRFGAARRLSMEPGLSAAQTCPPRPQLRDRLVQAFSVSEEYAKLSEVAVAQFRQDFRVHRVVPKCGLVLAESEAS